MSIIPPTSDNASLPIGLDLQYILRKHVLNEPVHEISKDVVCETSKASDQHAHTCSLIRAFASRLSIL